MTIFDELTAKNIPYAVVVAKVRSYRGKIDGLGREYIITCLRSDTRGLEHRFKPSRTIKGLSEYKLKWGFQIRQFRDELEKYRRVIDNEDGRVYEQKTVSFRVYFKKHAGG